jgi:N-acetylneuraminate synthase
MIKDLKKLGYEVGYSDHTLPDESMLILSSAVVLGASWIEKHFTLDKTLPGNDHYHAMDVKDLSKFNKNLELLKEIIGTETKQCLPSENVSRVNARRSVYINSDSNKGKILKKEDLICKRPASGICASKYQDLIGKELTQDIKEDTVLKWKIIK